MPIDIDQNGRIRETPQPVAETMNRHWVIGDVHGCDQALQDLVGLLPSGDHLVFCGDVVGRGPGVRQCVDQVWSLVCKGRATWLLGNHEQRLIQDRMLQKALWPAAPEQAEEWVERIQSLPLMFQGKGWVATHAGFNPEGIPDLEIREPFWQNYDGRYGQVIVAHTPGSDVRRHGQIVLIDTGAVYGGHLTAFCPETEAVIQVQGLDSNEAHPRRKTGSAAQPQPGRSLVSGAPC